MQRAFGGVFVAQQEHLNQLIKKVSDDANLDRQYLETVFRRAYLLSVTSGVAELLAPEHRRQLVRVLRSRCESKDVYFYGAKADLDFLVRSLPDFYFERLDKNAFDDVDPGLVAKRGALIVADSFLSTQFMWRPGIGRSLGAFTKDLMVLFMEPVSHGSVNQFAHNGFVIQSGDLERTRRNLHSCGFYQVLSPFKISDVPRKDELSQALDGFGNYTIVDCTIGGVADDLGPFVVASRLSFG
nr:hypothetical protein BdHM001_14260 [Bdellovibrio sp. HM001]